MSPPHHFPLPGLVLVLAMASSSGAAPLANPDLYSATEDTALSITLPGVLSNDDPNGGPGGLSAVKVSDPAHGTVNLQPDGSFLYTPAANYFGPDSFQYKAVESQGPITFTVDQNTSVLNVRVQSNVTATGTSDDKNTNVKAKGTLTAQIIPGQAPFSSAQIRTMNIATAERATLTLCVAPFCLGTLTARIEPDGLLITMREDQAGPAVPVTAGVFSQTGNLIDATGTLFLSTGGLAGGITVPPTADLNSTNTAYDFINAGITQTGGTLTLAVPITITQTITDPAYTATVTVTGTMHATAQAPPPGAQSAPATVTLDILSIDDPPTAIADRYYTRQNHAISVPATGSVPVDETLIAGNSVWKYSTGASLGTTWRATDFVDTSWSTGAGVLGYDTDNPIATTIPASATTGGTKYHTAYFRKEFNLTAPGATLDARVEFQRDDAVIIYVNGTEVYRDSTPYTGSTTPPLAATGEIGYATYAAAGISPDSDGAIYKVVSIPASLFRGGKNVIAAEVHQAGATSSDLRFDLKCFRTAQPTESLVGGSSAWKYSTGSDLGTAWRGTEFNDAAWSSAAGPLGYDTDILPASTIPSSAIVGGSKYPTAYFRREFTLTSPYDTVAPRVEFQRDDACVIYVNGVEIYRDSALYAGDLDLPLAATGEIAYATFAAATIPEPDSLAYKVVGFSRGLLREGKNVIAAEVHQAGATSSDLRFDLRALRTTGVGGLAANDTDTDGPAFNLLLHTAPANGSAFLNPDGSFTYLPGPGFPASGASATDTFVYTHTIGGQPLTSNSVVVPMGSTWKFLDNGTAAPQDALMTPADWRNAVFDDTAWGSGAGQLGYGDGDETTVVEDDATPGSPTAGSTTRYITTYFRHKFTWSGSAALLNRLKVRVVRDDGVAIFLNGRRIVRDNLTEGWNHLTLSDGSIGGTNETTPLEVFDIPASALLEGGNILSAEIHQSAADSSDISFDMELSAESVVGAKVEIVVLNDDLDGDDMSDTWERANGIDATVANASADADGDGSSNRSEFLAGTNPQLISSRLRGNSLTQPAAGQLSLNFDSVPGHLYQIQQSDALSAWQDTGTSFPAHASNPQTVRQFAQPADPRKFYRVLVVGDWR